MTQYKKIDDKDFYASVNKNFSKYKIPRTKKTLKEYCFPKKYEFQIPQKFLADFINPVTPYRGILVYHRIGAGKTCAAINIAENFKKQKKIMVVLPASLKGNFRSELRSPCTGKSYLSDNERALLKKYHPSSSEYLDIIKKANAKIDQYYTIYSYNKFIQLVQNKSLKLNNTLLIIDEIHNMISETGTYYEKLYDLIKASPPTMRLVIMSATPIFDKPIEIALTMNLLIPNKLPTETAFIKKFIDITYTTKGPVYNVKNMDIFNEHVKGFVSYYRGAPPYVFPRFELCLVKSRMSDGQQKMYSRVLKKESKKNKVTDYVNEDISNSFFIGTRMISNFYFPNGKLGEEGFKSLKKIDMNLGNLKEYSPKFYKILKKIKECEGTVFIYSNFKGYGGIKTFTKILEHHRFKNYQDFGPGAKRFAIWTGDSSAFLKDEVKEVFNNKNNTDGSKIKIILGSPSIKEGVSLLRVRQVHIIEPYWNQSRIFQVIGRAIRFCSHKDVPYVDQFVNIYIYIATHPKIKTSVDEYIMKMAITKERINGMFELALKESAVDCELFKNANVYPGEKDIICKT